MVWVVQHTLHLLSGLGGWVGLGWVRGVGAGGGEAEVLNKPKAQWPSGFLGAEPLKLGAGRALSEAITRMNSAKNTRIVKTLYEETTF